jgi:hypothetical protein
VASLDELPFYRDIGQLSGVWQIHDGRHNMVEFLRERIPPSFVSSPFVIHPERETACGVLSTESIVYFVKAKPALAHRKGGGLRTGTAHYHEQYRHTEGCWQISDVGFVRIFDALERTCSRVHIDLAAEPRRGFSP